LSLLLSQSLHNAIRMSEHDIVENDDVIQSNNMPLRYPNRPELEWPEHFHYVLRHLVLFKAAGNHCILLKYILSQLSLLNRVSWHTLC
jgi:hypothetical protein